MNQMDDVRGLRAPFYLMDKKALAHINPNRASRLAYVLHTAGDETRRNKAISPIAQREVTVFEELQNRFDPLSPDGEYISAVATVIIGISQDITRRKEEYISERQAADAEYDGARERMVKSSLWSIVIKAIYIGIKSLLFIALGGLLFQLTAPYIPAGFLHRTGHDAPSFLMSVATLAFGWWIGWKVNDFQRSSLEGVRNWRKQEAKMKYDAGRLTAFRQNWNELVSVWERYTGEKYDEAAFFELIIADDYQSEVESIAALRLKQANIAVLVYGHTRKACTAIAGAIRHRKAQEALTNSRSL